MVSLCFILICWACHKSAAPRVLFSGLGPTEKAQQNAIILAYHNFKICQDSYMNSFWGVFRIPYFFFIHHLPFCAEVAVGVGALAGWQHPLNGWQLIGRWMGIVCPAGSTIMLLTVPWFLVPWREKAVVPVFLETRKRINRSPMSARQSWEDEWITLKENANIMLLKSSQRPVQKSHGKCRKCWRWGMYLFDPCISRLRVTVCSLASRTLCSTVAFATWAAVMFAAFCCRFRLHYLHLHSAAFWDPFEIFWAKDTSPKSVPMQRSWWSLPSRAPSMDGTRFAVQLWWSMKRNTFFNPFFLKLSEISRYLVIQLPALYVDNQNPKIGLKAHLSAWRQDAFRTHWKRFHLGSGLCSLSDFEVFVPCTTNFVLAEPQSVQLSHFCRSLKRTIPRNLSRPKSASGNTSSQPCLDFDSC